MQCGSARRLTEAIATGRIDDAARQSLLAHAAVCPACEADLLGALRLPDEWESALSSRARLPEHGSERARAVVDAADGTACWAWIPDLTARLDGELGAERARALDAHLAVCPDCANERDLLLESDEVARGLRVEPRPELLSSLTALADTAARRQGRRATLRGATAAAAAVAAIALGLALWRPAATAPASVAPPRAVALAGLAEAVPTQPAAELEEPSALEPGAATDLAPRGEPGGTAEPPRSSVTVMNARRRGPRRAEPSSTRPSAVAASLAPSGHGVPPAGRRPDALPEERAVAHDEGPLGLGLEGWQRVVASLPTGPVASQPHVGPVVVDAVSVQANSSRIEPTAYATLY